MKSCGKNTNSFSQSFCLGASKLTGFKSKMPETFENIMLRAIAVMMIFGFLCFTAISLSHVLYDVSFFRDINITAQERDLMDKATQINQYDKILEIKTTQLNDLKNNVKMLANRLKLTQASHVKISGDLVVWEAKYHELQRQKEVLKTDLALLKIIHDEQYGPD
jgi:septal ring factor EnvC (AmiA/AmiB activator)